MTFAPANTVSPFLPTSYYLPEDDDERIIRNLSYLTDIGFKVNIREIAIYSQVEQLTGQQWDIPNTIQQRQTFRVIFYFGPIAAGANLVIPHNLTNVTSYTYISGTVVTDFPDNRSLNYSDTVLITNQMSLTVDVTNVNIVNGATAPNIISGIVILEYLKN